MGLGKTAATLVLHLINPAKTPAPGVPLDEEEWGSIGGYQVCVPSILHVLCLQFSCGRKTPVVVGAPAEGLR